MIVFNRPSLTDVIFLPGTVVHEFSHYLVYRYYGIPADLYLFHHDGGAETPSYVKCEKEVDDDIQVQVSLAPFLVVFPVVLTVSFASLTPKLVDVVLLWMGLSMGLGFGPSAGDLVNAWAAYTGQEGAYGFIWLFILLLSSALSMVGTFLCMATAGGLQVWG